VFDNGAKCPSGNVTDRWLLASAQDVLKFFHEEMKGYRLYTVVPKLFGFIEQLTNWYVRRRMCIRGRDGCMRMMRDATMHLR
jgi:isoleucyl-tRNA synthetase